MKDETKRKVATNIYNGAISFKKELISLKIPALIGLGLFLLCLLFGYICLELRMYYQCDVWFELSFYAFFLPILIVYIIRLKNWVIKWKEPID